jgi:hypothetical protein
VYEIGNSVSGIRGEEYSVAFKTYVPQRGPSVGKPSIRILKNGHFSISAPAYDKWFHKAQYVELLVDPRSRKVGLRPRSKPTKATYKLRLSPQGGNRRYVSGAQFLESFGVDVRKARNVEAKWNARQGLVEFPLK